MFVIKREWGSRGREFESRHSDQKALYYKAFYFCIITFYL